jgi:hypothetical protein
MTRPPHHMRRQRRGRPRRPIEPVAPICSPCGKPIINGGIVARAGTILHPRCATEADVVRR